MPGVTKRLGKPKISQPCGPCYGESPLTSLKEKQLPHMEIAGVDFDLRVKKMFAASVLACFLVL